jgi:hypothetical protein
VTRITPRSPLKVRQKRWKSSAETSSSAVMKKSAVLILPTEKSGNNERVQAKRSRLSKARMWALKLVRDPTLADDNVRACTLRLDYGMRHASKFTVLCQHQKPAHHQETEGVTARLSGRAARLRRAGDNCLKPCFDNSLGPADPSRAG